MSKNTLLVAKMFKDSKLPTKELITDAGWDFYYYGDTVYLKPFVCEILRTGIRIKLPFKTFGLVKPKSRSNYIIGGGVIDEEYTGELLVKIFNPTLDIIRIKNGDPIAQLVIIPIEYTETCEVRTEYLDSQIITRRGNSGGIVSQISGNINAQVYEIKDWDINNKDDVNKVNEFAQNYIDERESIIRRRIKTAS